MKKVFHFDSPQEKYECDAVILWCFDNRFDVAFRKFLARIGILHSDPVKIAGGAKCLASPDQESDREFVLEQIRKSIRLHGAKLAILMVHSDCGAYKGLQGGFGGDRRAEAEYHYRELRKAAASLWGVLPDLEIKAYFVDFEGVWEADVERPAPPPLPPL